MVVVAAHVELLGEVGEHVEALRKLEPGFTHFVVEAASQSGWNPNILTVGKIFTRSPLAVGNQEENVGVFLIPTLHYPLLPGMTSHQMNSRVWSMIIYSPKTDQFFIHPGT